MIYESNIIRMPRKQTLVMTRGTLWTNEYRPELQGPPNLWQHNFILKLNIFNFMP